MCAVCEFSVDTYVGGAVELLRILHRGIPTRHGGSTAVGEGISVLSWSVFPHKGTHWRVLQLLRVVSPFHILIFYGFGFLLWYPGYNVLLRFKQLWCSFLYFFLGCAFLLPIFWITNTFDKVHVSYGDILCCCRPFLVALIEVIVTKILTRYVCISLLWCFTYASVFLALIPAGKTRFRFFIYFQKNMRGVVVFF